jgi:hypothetical protein
MPDNQRFASADEALATLLPDRPRPAGQPVVPAVPDVHWPKGADLAAGVLERVDEHLKDSLSDETE